MSTTIPANRTSQQTAEQQLMDGLHKHEAMLISLTIGGTAYKVADVITVVQSLVNSAKTVVASKATWQTDVASDKTLRDKNKAFLSGLRQAVRVAFGNSIETLADFGLLPHKPRAVRTPQQKAAAAAKAKATRIARNTLGKVQKAKIKGTPATTTPAIDVTKAPAVSPTAPAPAPATASSTPPATTHS